MLLFLAGKAWCIVLWASVLLLVLISFSSSGASEGLHDDVWRTAPRCGVNSTYVFAKLEGVDLSYQSVREGVPLDSNGSSMNDMRLFLQSVGLDVDVVRGTPNFISTDLHLPAIAHVEQDHTELFPETERGHFVVMLSVEDGVVNYVDGTTAVIQTMDLDRFLRTWTGYLIVRSDRRGLSPLVFLLISFGIGVLCRLGVGSLYSRVKRRLACRSTV